MEYNSINEVTVVRKQILQTTGNTSRRFQEMNAIHSVKQYN